MTMLAVASTKDAMGGLSISGPACGELRCSLNEYCNFSERCEDCSRICDSANHNFDESVCTNNCQNYIHDLRYMKISQENSNLTATVESFEKEVQTLTVVCWILFFFVIVLGLAVILPRSKGWLSWITKKFQKKKIHCEMAFTHENPHTQSPVAPHRVRVQQPTSFVPAVQGAPEVSQNTLSASTLPVNNNQSQVPTQSARVQQSAVFRPRPQEVVEDSQNSVSASTSLSNNTPNNSRIDDGMAFTISSSGTICESSEHGLDQSSSNLNVEAEYEVPLQSSTPTNTIHFERQNGVRDLDHNEIPLNVRNLNRLTSSYSTGIPDTPETQSTRVEDMYLGSPTNRLPSEDCIIELRENNPPLVNPIQYNSPQRQVIYTTIPQASN